MRRPRVARNASDELNLALPDEISGASDDVLAKALEDLEAGMTPLQVLDRYPEHEAVLASLLETAYELRTTRWPAMSMAGRVAARERMHAALTDQKRRPNSVLSPVWRQLGVTLALLLMAGAAFLASPYSSFTVSRDADRPTSTLVVPALVVPTSTVVIAQPAPSFTPSPTATAQPTRTRPPAVTAQPTEVVDRIVAADFTRTATARPSSTSTATRHPPTQTPTATATVSVVGTASPAQTVVSSAPTVAEVPASPPPTVAPPPTPVKPFPTVIVPLTPLPELFETPTPQPSSTRKPKAGPTNTPRPTETARARPTRITFTPPAWTPGPGDTPESTGTPVRNDAPDSSQSIPERPGQPPRLIPPQQREFLPVQRPPHPGARRP